MSKPKVFIASSVEGLNIAYPIQQNLVHDLDCTVWPQGVFQLSHSPLDSLVQQLENSDFAIFVFSPDDEITMRDTRVNAVRDNVLFELGLFLGRLGKQRCFIVTPDAPKMHISSDLVGVTPATYSTSRGVAEIAAALGPACHEIRLATARLGRLKPNAPAAQIPATDTDNYDDEDKTILLSDWLNTAVPDIAYKFDEIDDKVKLERGTSKRLLRRVVDIASYYRISQESKYFFTLEASPLV